MADKDIQDIIQQRLATLPTKTFTALDPKSKQVLDVPESQLEDAIKSGKLAFNQDQEFEMVGISGKPFTVKGPTKALQNLKIGAQLDTPQTKLLRELKAEFGGQPLKAGLLGALSNLSFSLSDRALVSLDVFDEEELKAIRAFNKGADLTGEAVGFGLPLILTGGASGLAQAAGKGVVKGATKGTVKQALKKAAKFTPGGIAGTIGKNVEKKILGDVLKDSASKSLAKRIVTNTLAKGASGAIEGATVSGTQLLREEALGEPNLNAEMVLAHVSKGALFGGAFGGILGAAETTIPILYQGAKGKVELVSGKARDILKSRTTFKENAYGLFGISPKKASKLEASRPSFATDFEDFVREKIEGNVFTSAGNLKTQVKEVVENAGKQIGNIIKRIDETLPQESRNIFARKVVGGEVAASLDDSLSRLIVDRVGQKENIKFLTEIRNEFIEIADRKASGPFLSGSKIQALRQDLQTKINSFGKFTGKNPAQNALAQAKSVLDGKIDDAIATLDQLGKQGDQQALSLADQLRKANRDYRVGINIVGDIADKAAKDAEKSLFSMRELLTGFGTAGAFGSPTTGAIAAGAIKFAQSDLKRKMVVFGQMDGAIKRTRKIVDNAVEGFIDKTKLSTNVMKKIVPSTSTKILNEVNFNPENKKTPKDETRLQAYRRVRTEIQNLQTDPERLIELTARRTTQLRAAAPQTASAIEMAGMRMINFLADKLPLSYASTVDLQPNLRDERPSEIDLARFERYVEGALNPMIIMKDLVNNTLKRETVEAVKMIYPTLYEDIRQNLLKAVNTAEKRLPYPKRLQLGILFDLPTDASLESSNILALQQQFGMAAQQMSESTEQNAKQQLRVNSRILSNATVSERESSRAQKIQKK